MSDWAYSTRLTLAARPSAPRWARALMRDALTRWGFADFVETAELLVSELVTNAVEALTAPGTAVVVIRVSADDRVLIEVWDPDPRPPVLIRVGPDAESGRGLLLVERLAKDWGHYRDPYGGKIVWCELVRCA
ncbi:MAG TPA: ATP-binding protein [Streptosporangiaceae bacterium]